MTAVSPWCELEGHVQAPDLATDARLRPSRFKPHEEQELEDIANRQAFQALPVKWVFAENLLLQIAALERARLMCNSPIKPQIRETAHMPWT